MGFWPSFCFSVTSSSGGGLLLFICTSDIEKKEEARCRANITPKTVQGCTVIYFLINMIFKSWDTETLWCGGFQTCTWTHLAFQRRSLILIPSAHTSVMLEQYRNALWPEAAVSVETLAPPAPDLSSTYVHWSELIWLQRRFSASRSSGVAPNLNIVFTLRLMESAACLDTIQELSLASRITPKPEGPWRRSPQTRRSYRHVVNNSRLAW